MPVFLLQLIFNSLKFYFFAFFSDIWVAVFCIVKIVLLKFHKKRKSSLVLERFHLTANSLCCVLERFHLTANSLCCVL